MGVRDSKDMTDDQIKALVPKIKEVVPYKLLTLWPEKHVTKSNKSKSKRDEGSAS